jgi:hypothetical protein
MAWAARLGDDAPVKSLARLVVLGIALGSCPAAAQTDEAAAEVLFREAQGLFDEGRFAEACPKFAASQRLDPGLGTLLNLARCYESEGRTASAWLAYVELVPIAERAGQPDRARIARERIEALQPRLMRLRLVVPAQVADMVVELDGDVVAPAAYQTAIPVDRGKHVIEAHAPGTKPWSTEVTLGEEGETVALEVPSLEAEPVPPPTPPLPRPAPVPTAPIVAQPAPVSEPTNDSGLAWKVGAGVTAGIGLVAIGVGAGFAADASSAWKRAEEAGCGAGACPTTESQASSEQAGRSADVATGMLVGGSLVAAAGLVLFLVGVFDDDTSSDRDTLDREAVGAIGVTSDGLRIRF